MRHPSAGAPVCCFPQRLFCCPLAPFQRCSLTQPCSCVLLIPVYCCDSLVRPPIRAQVRLQICCPLRLACFPSAPPLEVIPDSSVARLDVLHHRMWTAVHHRPLHLADGPQNAHRRCSSLCITMNHSVIALCAFQPERTCVCCPLLGPVPLYQRSNKHLFVRSINPEMICLLTKPVMSEAIKSDPMHKEVLL